MLNRKFLKLVAEITSTMATRTNIVSGDVVEFVNDFKSSDFYKSAEDNIKRIIDEWVSGDQHIRVVGFRKPDPNQMIPSMQPTSKLLVLALDEGGSRWSADRILVPSNLVERDVNEYPNLSSIPNSWRYDAKITIKPEEVEEDAEEQSRKTDDGSGKYRKSDLQTPKNNTTIPSPKTTVVDYMKGIK